MKKLVVGLAAGLIGFCAAQAAAEIQSEMLFEYKHWQVEIDQFDDGTLACQAAVDAGTDSFTIWTYPDSSARLQFYSTAWEFGEGDTANLELAIDRRTPWILTNAELYKNSVLFDLPDSDDGVRFLVEVAQGSRISLRSEDGTEVQNYSLAGSRASIEALVNCGDMISGPSNPFN